LVNDQNKLTLGRREYELANHLGNVLATVSDVKLPEARVLSHTDYYAFGGAMPGRSGGAYRYGFNTQERSPELAPDHYTAEFWEYDARIGHRWNLDPRPVVGISEYAALGNSPIWASDVRGDSTFSYSYATASKIVTGMNNVYRRKYGDNIKEPFRVVTVSEVWATVSVPVEMKWYNPWTWDGEDERVQKVKLATPLHYITANKGFNWNTDIYTQKMFDALNMGEHTQVKELPGYTPTRSGETLSDNHGYTLGPHEIWLDADMGKQPFMLKELTEMTWHAGGTFMHEVLFHLMGVDDFGLREPNPRAMQAHYKLAASGQHGAGSNYYQWNQGQEKRDSLRNKMSN
jgi:hypothetical protein